jgi:hypothetical protein
VAFSIDDDPDDACFIAWTTTPWWVALCMYPAFPACTPCHQVQECELQAAGE